MNNHTLSVEKSIYMDFIRIFAALVVAAMHILAITFPERLDTAYNVAHSAVVIFFVLSGYVISYTTNVKNRGAVQYAVARLSRLYSILIPALLISLLVEYISFAYGTEKIINISRGNTLIRYLLSLFFINEAWFFSSAPPINAPLWSLSYEFSYYLIFGIYFFKNRIKYFKLILLFVILFVGPKILLLMPIWIFGVLVFKIPQLKIGIKLSITLSLISLLVGILVVGFFPSLPQSIGTRPLFFSAGFLKDSITGIFFASSLWLFPSEEFLHLKSNKAYHYIRKISDLTFPIYILHYPLITLYSTFFILSFNDWYTFFSILVFVIFISIFVGIYLEKSRIYYSRLFNYFFISTINYFNIKKIN